MTRFLRIAAVSLVFILASLTFVIASACAQESSAEPADPPSRVARLSYLSGNVSFQPNGIEDWVPATLNRPLTTSERLWTNRAARVELQTGEATMRLDGETSFTLANLDDRRIQIEIAQGIFNVHLRRLEPEESFEIDTPNFTVNLLRAGEYRIQVDNAGNVSWVTVRSGSAEVTGGSQAVTLEPGQQTRFSGADEVTYEVSAAPGPDGFDQWCTARDRRHESSRSAEYVSPGVIGYEDLDEYGTWRTYADYGQVWVPTMVSVGWAPYRFGHWAWVYPWGWTWIDDAPWGFAPFHYGRWVHAGFGWAWVPGPVYVRPVYAPALVAWCGGSGFGVGFAIGSGVGWFPLGPREPYIPWYWGSRHYFSRVNVTNTRIINVNNYYNNYYYPHWRDHDRDHWRGGPGAGRPPEHAEIATITHIDYRNRRAPNGVTFVDKDAFVNGRPVSGAVMNLPPDRVRQAPVLAGIDMKPDRASVLEGRDRANVRPPHRAFDRPVVSSSVPPRPTPLDLQTNASGRPVAPRHPVIETRTTTDTTGRQPTHVSVTAPQLTGAAPNTTDHVPSGLQPGNAMRPVPQPPATANRESRATSGDGPTRTETPSSRPRWIVPRPPETRTDGANAFVNETHPRPTNGAVTLPRNSESAVQQPARPDHSEQIRERVNVDTAKPRPTIELMRPRDDQAVPRPVEPERRSAVPQPSAEHRAYTPAPQNVDRPSPSSHVDRPNPAPRVDRPVHNVERPAPAPHVDRPAPQQRPAEVRPSPQPERAPRTDSPRVPRTESFREHTNAHWR